MGFKDTSENDTVVDVLLDAFVLHDFGCKAIKKNLKGKSKGVPSIKWYKMNLWAFDRKSFEPCL